MYSQRLRNFTLFLTFTLLLFSATSFSIFLITNHKGLIIWLPSGCALAVLVMFGLRFWPSVALGVLMGAILADLPVVSALGMVLAIVIASLIASYLLLRVNFCYTLEHSRDLLILFIVTLFYAAIGASIALIGQSIGGLIPRSVFGGQWLIMWVGDITSIMVIAPALFIWRTPFRLDIRKYAWNLCEAGLLVVTLVICTLYLLRNEFKDSNDFYIFFPFFIWTGLRFGKRGATAGILLVITNITGLYDSQFSKGLHPITDLLSLEFAIGIVVLMSLLLAVEISERQQTQSKLKELNEHLEQHVLDRTHKLSMEISERLKIEAALRESEQRYRGIIENSVDGILLLDTEGRVQEWNLGLENITGLQKSYAIGKYFWDIIFELMPDDKKTADTYEYCKTSITQLITAQVPNIGRYPKISFQHPNGTIRTIQIVGFFIEIQQKLLLSGIIRDETEQEIVAEAISNYNQRLQVLHGIDHDILAAKSVEHLINTVLPNLQRLVNSQSVNVITYNRGCKEFTFLGTEIDQQTKEELAFCFESGLDQNPPKLEQGEILLITDLQSLPEITPFQKVFLSRGVRTLLNIPILLQDIFYGTITLGAIKPNAFDHEQIDIAREVTNEVAIAIQQAHLIEQIQTGREESRQLAQRVVMAQEEERRRLSRELHDEAGQALTALKISLELIAKDLPEELTSFHQRLDEAITLSDNTMEQIRLLARGLRPPALDMVGLNYTLEDLCRDYARRTKIKVDYQGENIPLLPEEINICYYRILQESLTNILKHAHAEHIRVTLQQSAGSLSLIVKDDGRGFSKVKKNQEDAMGIGLLGIKERLENLGGKLKIESISDQGTTLFAYIPWERFYTESSGS